MANESYAQTVGGPVPYSDLGRVLPHEHLLIDLRAVTFQEPSDERGRALARRPIAMEHLGWVRRHWTSSLDNLYQLDEALATAELRVFAETGGGTIVDATVPGIGRDPAALARTNAIFEVVYFRGIEQAEVVAGNADIGATHFGFHVEDIDATVAQLGLEVSGAPSDLPIGPYRGGRSVYLKDPNGANIQLMQLAGRPGRMPVLRPGDPPAHLPPE